MIYRHSSSGRALYKYPNGSLLWKIRSDNAEPAFLPPSWKQSTKWRRGRRPSETEGALQCTKVGMTSLGPPGSWAGYSSFRLQFWRTVYPLREKLNSQLNLFMQIGLATLMILNWDLETQTVNLKITFRMIWSGLFQVKLLEIFICINTNNGRMSRGTW